MKRFSPTTAAIVCCLLWQTAAAQSIEQILKQHYPQHSAQNQCLLGKSFRYYSGDTPTPVRGDYCFIIDAQQTVNTAQGKMHYILLTGNGIDLKTGEWQTAHVDSGAVGMLVLKARADGGWQIVAANTGMPVGAFGSAPQNWALHQFGPDTWGFINQSSDIHQGYAGSRHVILLPLGNKISMSQITAESDNSGALGECGADMGFDSAAERQDCRSRRETITSRLNIDHGGTTVAGLYPLQLTVNGFSGNKKYRNQIVRIPFDRVAGQYREPKSSPLRGADF